MAIAELTMSFTGTGRSSDSVRITGDFDVSVSGINGSVVDIERSFDGGSNWFAVKSYSANAEEAGFNARDNVLYTANCTTYGSGTVTVRIAQ